MELERQVTQLENQKAEREALKAEYEEKLADKSPDLQKNMELEILKQELAKKDKIIEEREMKVSSRRDLLFVFSIWEVNPMFANFLLNSFSFSLWKMKKRLRSMKRT